MTQDDVSSKIKNILNEYFVQIIWILTCCLLVKSTTDEVNKCLREENFEFQCNSSKTLIL